MINTEQTTEREVELRMVATKLSKVELNEIIDGCVDKKNYEDAVIYAKIYKRRYGKSS